MKNLSEISLVDSHCHLHYLDLSAFAGGMDEVISLAHANNIKHMLCVCCELGDLDALYRLAAKYSELSISVGIHPNTVMESEIKTQDLVELARHPACIAIGETGLDYYRIKTSKSWQVERFRAHIRAALSSSKPLIIHTRAAAQDTIAIMASENARDIGGVMHCFSEDWDIAKRALDLNFYISFSGVISFKNATSLQEVLKKIPLERLLIETDAPYLAPVPLRGQQNHPALLKHTAIAISKLRAIDLETLALHTTQNFYRCFRLAL